jgi:S-adenosylmethionine:tRNA ribosyltransferase-isomerase
MNTSEFDFHLPEELIAQTPAQDRDAARLLVIDRAAKSWSDRTVRELPAFLKDGDLLIVNDTRVIPARLRAVRDSSGGKVEILLLPPETETGTQTEAPAGAQYSRSDGNSFVRRVLMKSGGRIRPGETLTLRSGPRVKLLETHGEAGHSVRFCCTLPEFNAYIATHGEVPLPPYIRRGDGPSAVADIERYQTVFARAPGAVAAPTAGLHFTPAVFDALEKRGVRRASVTLHVGPGTFRPVKAEKVEDHFVDPEPYHIPPETVSAIRLAKTEGRRVIAVGTTSLRTLEGAAAELLDGGAPELAGATNLYVYPPYGFRVADGLLTNFHIPRSSLLMLVCAFAAPGSTDGIALLKGAYEHAVGARYRFYSYGDACLFL